MPPTRTFTLFTHVHFNPPRRAHRSVPRPTLDIARRAGSYCTGVRAFSRARKKVFCFYFSNLPLTISNKLKRGHEIMEFYESALQP